MRLIPKFPDGMSFWRKWNFICIMFTGGCLLATRFYKDYPEIVSQAENLMWFGAAALLLGIVMLIIKRDSDK